MPDVGASGVASPVLRSAVEVRISRATGAAAVPEFRVRIERVDPRDDDAFSQWFSVADQVEEASRPGEPHGVPGERRAAALAALSPDHDTDYVLLLARDGERPVGAAGLELPRRDNLHLAEIELAVLPDARRRGVGTALLDEAERIAAEHGRTTVLAGVDEPPAEVGRSPGRAFAQRHGYAFAQTEVRRDMPLPLDPERAARLAADCAQHARGYAVRTWRDRCPDDVLDDMAALKQAMSTDAPLGDTDYQEKKWDAARVRQREQIVGAQGRTFFAAGAVHEASGRLVAFTDVGIAHAQPERAFQWETLVVKEHRGRRLGTLVKLACLQRIAQEHPASRYVSTWNAAENAPMIRVNDALGARTNGELSLWQRRRR